MPTHSHSHSPAHPHTHPPLSLPPLPRVLPRPGKLIPFPVLRLLIEPLLQRQIRAAGNDHDLGFLRNRLLAVQVPDIGLELLITRGRRGVAMVHGDLLADATLRADLPVFVSMALEQQDPDTLFFRRRLSISGDTELSLEVKNFLYRIEWLPEVVAMSRHLEQFMLAFAPSRPDHTSSRLSRSHPPMESACRHHHP